MILTSIIPNLQPQVLHYIDYLVACRIESVLDHHHFDKNFDPMLPLL